MAQDKKAKKKLNKPETNQDETKGLYRGKFCIGLYDSDDELIGLFDNPREMAEFLNKSLQIVKNMVSRTFNDNRKQIIYNNKLVNIEIIDITETTTTEQ